MIRMSINDSVWVKLNRTGLEIHRQHYEDAKPVYSYLSREVTPNGYYKFPLWELMQIFGPHIEHSKESPFEMDICLTVDV